MAEEVVANTDPAPAEPAPTSPQGTPAPAVTQGEPGASPEETKAQEAPVKEEPKSEAPEEYTDFTDEKGVAFSAKEMPEFTAMAKELGLSQEKANKLLMTMVPTVRGKLQQSVQAVNDSWKRAALSDPEFGGENFRANMITANAAYKKFATPELASLMKGTGLSMHPDFIRMFYRIGKAMSEDTGVTGTGTPQPRHKRFPNSDM